MGDGPTIGLLALGVGAGMLIKGTQEAMKAPPVPSGIDESGLYSGEDGKMLQNAYYQSFYSGRYPGYFGKNEHQQKLIAAPEGTPQERLPYIQNEYWKTTQQGVRKYAQVFRTYTNTTLPPVQSSYSSVVIHPDQLDGYHQTRRKGDASQTYPVSAPYDRKTQMGAKTDPPHPYQVKF